jgi:hypothetical protein
LTEVGEVVVKPTRGEQGKGITVGVTADNGPDELAAAVARARAQYPEVLIEQRVDGDDLRLVVIDGRVVAAALRVPPEIIGTGEHTVRDLIVEASPGSRSTKSPRRRSLKPVGNWMMYCPKGRGCAFAAPPTCIRAARSTMSPPR